MQNFDPIVMIFPCCSVSILGVESFRWAHSSDLRLLSSPAMHQTSCFFRRLTETLSRLRYHAKSPGNWFYHNSSQTPSCSQYKSLQSFLRRTLDWGTEDSSDAIDNTDTKLLETLQNAISQSCCFADILTTFQVHRIEGQLSKGVTKSASDFRGCIGHSPDGRCHQRCSSLGQTLSKLLWILLHTFNRVSNEVKESLSHCCEKTHWVAKHVHRTHNLVKFQEELSRVVQDH
mmetsp:Transcript_23062/g.44985  ORF Transcript_23062/g.44985 Transcript_23062/m.44985 type:complete len:231 (-) Transcript_23062:761-1453(-)